MTDVLRRRLYGRLESQRRYELQYRQVQRGRMTGTATRGNTVAYGEYGIQALEPGWITGNGITASGGACHAAALHLAVLRSLGYRYNL